MSKLKPMPTFKNEEEEAKFWELHDSTDYFDYNKPLKIDFSNVKPTTQKITLRLPKMLVKQLKRLANERDVPYQSLVKVLLNEKVHDLQVA